MNFREELNKIIPKKSSKINKVKKILKDSAKKGDTSATLSKSFYDDDVVTYLRSEGFEVELVDDPRDGDYIFVKW